MLLYVGDCLVSDGHLHRVTYTRCHIDTINSPDDEHVSARNMQRFGINIYEKRIVRQVGHLKELYWDARSTKHKRTIRRLTMCICKVYVLEKQHSTEIQVHEAIGKVHGILQTKCLFLPSTQHNYIDLGSAAQHKTCNYCLSSYAVCYVLYIYIYIYTHTHTHTHTHKIFPLVS